MRLTRPSVAAERAEEDVGVVHDRPGRADHDHQPAEDEDREVDLQVAEEPALIGSTNHAISASPAPVRDRRSCSAERAQDR